MRCLWLTGALLAAPLSASADPSIVDDASDLANLLAGDTSTAPAIAPVARGPVITVRPAVVTIGNDSVGFRGDASFQANMADIGLPLALQRLQTTTLQHQETVTRTTLETGPKLGALQPAGQPVKLDGRQLRAMSRCYRKVPGLEPGDRGDVELTFEVDRKGRVKAPVVMADEDELIGCIGNVMKSWEFPSLKKRKDRIWVSVVLTAG